jgi:predicted outer membrane protein
VRKGRISAGLFLALSLITAVAAGPTVAQTTADPSPPPPSTAKPNDTELTTNFVAGAIPSVNYIAAASRMAVAHSPTVKIRNLAGELAKDQTALANSLASWVNVSGPVVTLRSPFTGLVGPGAPKLKAPRLLPSQASNLQRLSTSQGRDFDTLYVSTLMEALVQLQILYRDFAQAGGDPGLRAIADRELPKVEHTISTLDAL